MEMDGANDAVAAINERASDEVGERRRRFSCSHLAGYLFLNLNQLKKKSTSSVSQYKSNHIQKQVIRHKCTSITR